MALPRFRTGWASMLSAFDRGVPALLALYGVVVLAALVWVPRHFLPAEDAVILHQYSRNLAQHGVISYYAGGPRAEGATEFGWMVMVAAALRLHVAPRVFTAGVNLLSLLLIAAALLRIARRRRGVRPVLALAGAAGLMPQIFAAMAGFAVLPEAALLLWLVEAVLRRRALRAALLALGLCLFRPEAVLFAMPLLTVLVLEAPREGAARRRALGWIAAGFVVPGCLYFAWRAHYFGELFPLPLLVKGAVHRSFGVLVPHSLLESSKYLLLDAAVLMPLWRNRAVRWRLVLPWLVLPTLFFWTVRLDQNVGDRFFFYLPLGAAVLVAEAWAGMPPEEQRRLVRIGSLAFAVVLLGPLLRELRSFRDYQFRDVQAIAQGLRRLPVRGTLLTSEGGYLPYDSGWVAVDAWGLNTATFARRPIEPEDVVRLHPDLIALHPNHPGGCTEPASSPREVQRSWEAMVGSVVAGARQAGTYQLWLLPYGSAYRSARMHWARGQGDQECFFVDQRSPDRAGMAALLRAHGAVPEP